MDKEQTEKSLRSIVLNLVQKVEELESRIAKLEANTKSQHYSLETDNILNEKR